MDNPADKDHLRLLSIFHYVVAGILAFCSLIPIVHLVLGIMVVTGVLRDTTSGQPAPDAVGWFLIVFAAGSILLGLSFSLCVAMAGRNLARRRRHLYCMIIAGIECFFMPLGTILGVFTIIVLQRQSVKQLFGVQDT